jgi:hypothetical protein
MVKKKAVQSIPPDWTDMKNTGERALMLIAALGFTVPLNGCANSGIRTWVAGLKAFWRGVDRRACTQLPAAQAIARHWRRFLADAWANRTTSHGRLMLTVLGARSVFRCG